MPNLPKRRKPKPTYPTDERKPTGEQSLYNNTWANVSKQYRIANPLCELCMLQGKLTDASPGDRKGVTDHVVAVTKGGARMDERNFATLCKPCHDRKSILERNGWKCSTYGRFGDFKPIDKEAALRTLIKKGGEG